MRHPGGIIQSEKASELLMISFDINEIKQIEGSFLPLLVMKKDIVVSAS